MCAVVVICVCVCVQTAVSRILKGELYQMLYKKDQKGCTQCVQINHIFLFLYFKVAMDVFTYNIKEGVVFIVFVQLVPFSRMFLSKMNCVDWLATAGTRNVSPSYIIYCFINEMRDWMKTRRVHKHIVHVWKITCGYILIVATLIIWILDAYKIQTSLIIMCGDVIQWIPRGYLLYNINSFGDKQLKIQIIKGDMISRKKIDI